MRASVIAFAVLLSTACQKPEPPKLTPREVSLTALSPTGVSFLVKLDAANPNSFTMSANSFKAHLVFNETIDAGTVDVQTPFAIAPKATTELSVPVSLNWQGLSALALLGKPTIPYRIDGTVNIGGERLNVDLPYAVSGVVTQAQILEASAKGLQNVFPGLPDLQRLLPGAQTP